MSRLAVVGDVILDRDLVGDVSRICPDAPAPVVDLRESRERPGGAGLAAVLLAGSGHDVTLLTSAGPDPDGAAVRQLLTTVHVVDVTTVTSTRSVTRVRSGGQSLLRIDREGGRLAADAAVDTLAIETALESADAVLVSDYGAGVASHPQVREALRRAAARRPLVWDPHPRGPVPVPGAAVVTPNRAEARHFAAEAGADEPARRHLDATAEALRRRWQVHAVSATDGAHGVFTALAGSPPVFVPTPSAHPGDTCGAGDRFAGAVAAALADGSVITEAVAAAVEDTAAWLAAGGVASLAASPAGAPQSPGTRPADGTRPTDALGVAAAVRAAGGTVVATGGCFDVVHAGHVASLQAARRLGDCLVVLLNSDDAVRRLKGPTRPVHGVADRIAVLRSLECVDAVMVFDDVTPEAALDRLRPDVWAKGGDYAEATLPEAALVQSWGGRVVLLPYLPGRSTTSILNRSRPTRSRAGERS